MMAPPDIAGVVGGVGEGGGIRGVYVDQCRLLLGTVIALGYSDNLKKNIERGHSYGNITKLLSVIISEIKSIRD